MSHKTAAEKAGVFKIPAPDDLVSQGTEMLSELNRHIDDACAVLRHYRTERPGSIYETPLADAPWLSTPDCRALIKLESEQITGSFKARGALNRVHAAAPLADGEKLVTASTGNHGLGVVHALCLTGCAGLVFLPENAAGDKVARLRRVAEDSPVELRFAGNDSAVTEAAAAALCETGAGTFVSPYNDRLVMAGQGTIADEIVSQLAASGKAARGRRACYVAVGGGGLVCGVAARLKALEPGLWRVVGCQPLASAVLSASVRGGRVLELDSDDTLSDGTAGGVEQGSETLALAAALVDAWAIVAEGEIGAAMVDMFRKQGKTVEGAAGVAVAGCLADARGRAANGCDTAVVVACGGNVDSRTFVQVLSDGTKGS